MLEDGARTATVTAILGKTARLLGWCGIIALWVYWLYSKFPEFFAATVLGVIESVPAIIHTAQALVVLIVAARVLDELFWGVERRHRELLDALQRRQRELIGVVRQTTDRVIGTPSRPVRRSIMYHRRSAPMLLRVAAAPRSHADAHG